MLWFQRKRREQDLERELRSHLELEAVEQQEHGLAREEARYAARKALGNRTLIQEDTRAVWFGHWPEELGRDLRYGFRALRKNPAFSVVAVLTLALGIGANTAMFSVSYGMLLRPLPYANADRLAVVFMSYFPRDFLFGTMSIRDYLTWRENNHAFEDPSLFRSLRMDVSSQEQFPEQVQGASVTAGFFSVLGVRPLIGRTLAPGEDQPTTGSLAVLSESLWRRRFATDIGVLGKRIAVNGVPATVIGVMPARFQFPPRAEIWTNLLLNPPARYGPWFYRGIARLKPGITLQQAQADIAHVASLLMAQNPYYKRLKFPVLGLRDALLGNTTRRAMLVLVGAVALVLLIVIVNVANLMLARATVREREMALRLSLGAARTRLARQLLTESALLGLLGGAAGAVLAWAAIQWIRAWNPGNLLLIDSIRLDRSALVFMLLVSIVSGLLFGLAPALESVRADLNSTLKERGRSGAAHGRTRAALVVSEIAISLMLLIGAALLLRSFVNLQKVNVGASAPPDRILTMLISPADPKYRATPAGLAFYREVLRRARNLPGIERAALTDSLPPDRQADADTFGIEGQTLAPGQLNPVISDVTVTPEFFRTAGIELIKGRYFNDHDKRDSEAVVIVSDGFVRRFLPNQDALGKRIRASGPTSGNPWMRIVGVVANVKYLGLTIDTDAAYYMPLAQSYNVRMILAVRSSGDAALLAAPLREAIQSIDRGVTLAQIGTLQQSLQLSVSEPRFDAMVIGLFAAIALLLAGVGIYGLVAYTVAQRTREIGVRMALGAAQADVVGMVLRQAALLAALGVLIGLGGAFALTGFLEKMVFGIGVKDELTFAAAPVGIIVVVLLATLFPALRATRISPLGALRHE